jgi:hypothetical protein
MNISKLPLLLSAQATIWPSMAGCSCRPPHVLMGRSLPPLNPDATPAISNAANNKMMIRLDILALILSKFS